MARERYNWLDIMKLIAIWLMYITHYDGMGRFGILGLYSVLGILFFSHIFQQAFDPSCHLSRSFIQLLDLNAVRNYRSNILVLPFSNLFNVMKDLRNWLRNTIG